MLVVVVMVVLVLVIVASAFAMLVVVVMVVLVMMVMRFGFKLFKGILKSITALHSTKDICTRKLVPRRCDYNSISVMLLYKGNRLLDLLLLRNVGMRKNDSGRVSYLIVIKLAEVFHIHFAFTCIRNGSKAIKHRIG